MDCRPFAEQRPRSGTHLLKLFLEGSLQARRQILPKAKKSKSTAKLSEGAARYHDPGREQPTRCHGNDPLCSALVKGFLVLIVPVYS